MTQSLTRLVKALIRFTINFKRVWATYANENLNRLMINIEESEGSLVTYCNWRHWALTAGLNNSIGPIARNCPKWPSSNRIYGLKLPAKLVFWKFGQQTFSCVKQLLTAHSIRSWFWEVICKVTVKLLFIISMISSPLSSIWLYDKLGITPWMIMTHCK